MTTRTSTARTADQWWAWHDTTIEDTQGHATTEGASRYETLEEAEEACQRWVAGDSDEGPDVSHA